jgi:hypothetical protein
VLVHVHARVVQHQLRLKGLKHTWQHLSTATRWQARASAAWGAPHAPVSGLALP